MRWKIKSVTTKEEDNKLITTTTKAFAITVGDIAGVARTATGALTSLASNFTKFIKTINDPTNKDSLLSASQSAAIAALNSFIQPMAAVAKGLEVYQKVMKVASIVSPILQMIARATGVWVSPGNAGDIADIIGGTIVEILSNIAMSIFLMLKEWIWNYEFELWQTSDEMSTEIARSLEKFAAELRKKTEKNLKTGNSDENGNLIGTTPIKTNKKKYAKDNDLGSEEAEVNIIQDTYVTQDTDGTQITATKYILATWNKSSYYKTIYKIKDQTYPRMLRGSDNNGGIQYSDDNGKSWKNTDQKSGSFCCFGKLITEDEENYNITYFAASAPYIKKVINTEDEEFRTMASNIENTNKFNKAYYSKNKKQLTRQEKEKGFDADNVYEPDKKTKKEGSEELMNYIPASGLWKSDNDGITWTQVSSMSTGYYGKLYEFLEKFNEPFTLVAATYGEDYNGIYWTQDGDNWNRSKVNLPDNLSVDSEVKWPNISIIDANFIVNVYPNDISSNMEIETSIYVKRITDEFESFETKLNIGSPTVSVRGPEWYEIFKRISAIIHEVTCPEALLNPKDEELSEEAAEKMMYSMKYIWQWLSHDMNTAVLADGMTWYGVAKIITIGENPNPNDDIGRVIKLENTISNTSIKVYEKGVEQ